MGIGGVRMKDDYAIMQFKKDIDFILQHKDCWIFEPIFDIARRLVLFYMTTYESKEQK